MIFLSTMIFLCGCSEIEAAMEPELPVIDSFEELTGAVSQAMQEGKESYTFSTEELGQNELMKINEYVDSYYGYVNGYQATTGIVGKDEITCDLVISDNTYVERFFLYGEEIPEEKTKAIKIQKKCDKIIEKHFKDKETAYQKERAIHDYLVKSIAYGYPDDDKSRDSDAYSSYGALIKKEAVCNGYAQSMKLLCDIMEIPCKIVTGISHGENHAWNLVKLEDGEWYQVDATWDDPKPVSYTHLTLPTTSRV